MREKLRKMNAEVWHGQCLNADEEMIRIDIAEKLPELPNAEIEVFGWSDLYGRGVSAKQVWAYEEELAEIRREKERRMRKYMMKHEVRNDGKPVRKEKRKAYIKEKHCGSFDPYIGLMTVKKYRQIIAEKYDDRDYALEQEEIEESLMWERINFDEETERLKALERWLRWA